MNLLSKKIFCPKTNKNISIIIKEKYNESLKVNLLDDTRLCGVFGHTCCVWYPSNINDENLYYCLYHSLDDGVAWLYFNKHTLNLTSMYFRAYRKQDLTFDSDYEDVKLPPQKTHKLNLDKINEYVANSKVFT